MSDTVGSGWGVDWSPGCFFEIQMCDVMTPLVCEKCDVFGPLVKSRPATTLLHTTNVTPAACISLAHSYAELTTLFVSTLECSPSGSTACPPLCLTTITTNLWPGL